MCCFPISSVSVPKLGLKIVLWEWGWVHYIGSIKSCRGSLITNEIAKKKKRQSERARYRRKGSESNYNQANLM